MFSKRKGTRTTNRIGEKRGILFSEKLKGLDVCLRSKCVPNDQSFRSVVGSLASLGCRWLAVRKLGARASRLRLADGMDIELKLSNIWKPPGTQAGIKTRDCKKIICFCEDIDEQIQQLKEI